MDTGQFGDVISIGFICIRIQVKRMASQGSDINRPFVDKSHLLNIINDPLVS